MVNVVRTNTNVSMKTRKPEKAVMKYFCLLLKNSKLCLDYVMSTLTYWDTSMVQLALSSLLISVIYTCS